MSGDCNKCGEHAVDCRCYQTEKREMTNYFLEVPASMDEVRVWTQMFFDDGSVTQGRYVSRYIFDKQEWIENEARGFLRETGRREGVLFIWGAGRVYAKKAQLFLARRGTLKGSETLRLRNL